MSQDRVMLLIDADNVSVDVMEQSVRLLLNQHGGLHVRRAYCTAEGAVKHQAAFKRLGIKPMVNLAAGKNSTDIAMAVDAIDLVLAERPDVVVIASSDSDFAPLVQRLREKGCVVRGIGQLGKTGAETQDVYDDYTVLEHKRPSGAARSATGSSALDAAPPARKTRARKTSAAPAPEPAVASKPPAKKAVAGRKAPAKVPGAAKVVAAAATAVAAEATVAVETADAAAAPKAMPAAGAATAPKKTAARKSAAKRGAAREALPAATVQPAVAATPVEAAPAIAVPQAKPAARKAARTTARKQGAANAAAAAAAADSKAASPEDSGLLESATETAAMQPVVTGDLLPHELARRIMGLLPELGRGETVQLGVASQRLREAGLLSKSGPSTKLLGRFPELFELLPAGQPNQLRLRR